MAVPIMMVTNIDKSQQLIKDTITLPIMPTYIFLKLNQDISYNYTHKNFKAELLSS